jgi:hypothetical protein
MQPRCSARGERRPGTARKDGGPPPHHPVPPPPISPTHTPKQARDAQGTHLKQHDAHGRREAPGCHLRQQAHAGRDGGVQGGAGHLKLGRRPAGAQAVGGLTVHTPIKLGQGSVLRTAVRSQVVRVVQQGHEAVQEKRLPPHSHSPGHATSRGWGVGQRSVGGWVGKGGGGVGRDGAAHEGLSASEAPRHPP